MNIFSLTTILLLLSLQLVGQTDHTNLISEQIKTERDLQLKELSEKLKRNEDDVERLKEKLAGMDDRKANEKMNTLQDLQIALDSRLKILEEAPKYRISLNGQLAFTELLSIQRDIQPADLFLTSQHFYTELGNVANLQKYPSFNTWKTTFDEWSKKEKSNTQLISLINQSVKLIADPGKQIPLYGAFTQTVSGGITSLLASIGKKHQNMLTQTPGMLRLLNTASQFEHQKSIIDHEWALINKELEQLQDENMKLMYEQIAYYGLSAHEYEVQYVEETLDNKRDEYKNTCRKAIADRYAFFDADTANKGKWMGQVETYMYRVQSLRLRFGQLTNRMLSNIDNYTQLISVYSDSSKFPTEFTNNMHKLGLLLAAVKGKFYTTFNPSKYIEDSAVMYIERKRNF